MKDFFIQHKEEIINDALALLPIALSGDPANRTFYINKNGKVDYDYYLGQTAMNDRCFYTILSHETPDPEDYGYNNIKEMDFEDCGYREAIEEAINEHIDLMD